MDSSMAEDGDRYACVCIGRMYRRTSYKHYSTTVKWFRKAAEQGYANAQFHLGHMYELGWGVDRNDSTTVEWYRKAAEEGHADAQYRLGQMYENGWGVDINFSTALQWYRKAAEEEHVDAQ